MKKNETTTHLTGLNLQPSQDIVTMTSHEKSIIRQRLSRAIVEASTMASKLHSDLHRHRPYGSSRPYSP